MKGYIEERAVKVAQYIVDNNATVRQTAKMFGISKSTIHKDVSCRINYINPSLASEARKVLSRLNEMFKNSEVKKTYWAVVKNLPREEEGELVNYLVRNEKQKSHLQYQSSGRLSCTWTHLLQTGRRPRSA